MTQPARIQLSRKKGWRMPPNTIKVDRTTRWGNPFVVGPQGSAANCVYEYVLLISGLKALSYGIRCYERLDKTFSLLSAEAEAGYPSLRGKNLACWCEPGEPCHADALLQIANRPADHDRKFDLDAFMASYGLRLAGNRWVKGKRR